ncbi:hypothetical protein CROQUDRAFT_650942 [Cronartium quercuum f. sp. fusiforme G11]|uniref:Uncharacterized protein n=1 Tax=Cronartium quercuum f. sp. fusiforme G11 TaxID=708437 RepID=A0A9P6NY27_9BASI|nr:hypothetical protein CROQUDRAFT_650942 [Cronartium quercuum f. sp. fusiforme G11]
MTFDRKSKYSPPSQSTRHLLYSTSHSPSHSVQSPTTTLTLTHDSPSPASTSPSFPRHLYHHPPFASKPPFPIIALALSPPTNGPSHVRTLALAARGELKIVELHHHHQNLQERQALKLNAFGVADLTWGYSATQNTLLGGSNNGSILGWDQSSAGKLRRWDHAHGRAINKVVVAGPAGQWIVSGGQDGFVKVWDLRDRGQQKAQLVMTTHSDPIRQLRFHPHRTAQPFNLLSLTDSGTLTHFDLRYTSTKSCVARRVAHTTPGTGLDWSDEGLIATASSEGIVKVWNFEGNNLSTTARSTIVVGRPIRYAVWRPGFPFMLAVTPSAPMSDPAVVIDQGSGSSFGSTTTSTITNTTEEVGIGGRNSELLVWDIRRERVPELVIKGRDGPASGIVWLSADAMLTSHKRAGTVVIHDLSQVQERYADTLPFQALAVCPRTGSICFSNRSDDLTAVMVNGMETNIGLPPAFEFLALNYRFQGNSFEEVCTHNAKISSQAKLPKLVEIWRSFQLWFGSSNQIRDGDEKFLTIRMRDELWSLVKNSGNVQLNFNIAASIFCLLNIEHECLYMWTSNYLKLIKRFNNLIVISCEIKKQFPTRESEEVSLRILRQNLACGACGRSLESLGRKMGRRCGGCLKSYMICSLCHRVVKGEPFRFCGPCGHGIHAACLAHLEVGQRECVSGCGHSDCLMWDGVLRMDLDKKFSQGVVLK